MRRLEPGESDGLRAPFVATQPTLDRDRPGRLRGRIPARHDRHRSARRRRAPARGGQRLDGRDRRRAHRELPVGTPVTLVGTGCSSRSTHASRTRSTTSSRAASAPSPATRAAGGARCVSSRRSCSPARTAWVVGGAVRDELLGRDVLDLDIACRDPRACGACLREALGRRAVSALGAARRVAGRARRRAGPSTSRRCAAVIEDDLATRDFTINAIAVPLAGGEPVDPFGGPGISSRRRARRLGERVRDDPLRLLGPCGSRTSRASGSTRRPSAGAGAGRARARVPPASGFWPSWCACPRTGYRRADELGLLAPLRARARASIAASSSIARHFGSSRCSATRSIAIRCPTSSSATPGVARAGAARGRIAACHLPLPAGHRAVGARGAGVRRRHRARRKRACGSRE